MAVEAERLGNVARNKPQPVDAIIMSLVPNGDLSTLLKKVGTLRLQIPNRVLWSFFLCSKLHHANYTIILRSYSALNKRDDADAIYTVTRMCIG